MLFNYRYSKIKASIIVSGPDWIHTQMGPWTWIRIRNLDPDPQKRRKKSFWNPIRIRFHTKARIRILILWIWIPKTDLFDAFFNPWLQRCVNPKWFFRTLHEMCESLSPQERCTANSHFISELRLDKSFSRMWKSFSLKNFKLFRRFF